mmetsp:Transcript_27521/g.41886  ORF Transcript_27521/g.41886 Transcript_27521/m.41886 type:complete len:186 (-) Transcript_27521:1314-1871(-)
MQEQENGIDGNNHNSFQNNNLLLNHHNQQRELAEDFSYYKLDCKFCGPISDSMCKTLVGRSCQALGLVGGFGLWGGIAWGAFCDAMTTMKCPPEPGCPGDQYCECERDNQKRCGTECVAIDVCCPPNDYQRPDNPEVCILEGSVVVVPVLKVVKKYAVQDNLFHRTWDFVILVKNDRFVETNLKM